MHNAPFVLSLSKDNSAMHNAPFVLSLSKDNSAMHNERMRAESDKAACLMRPARAAAA